MVRHEPPPVLDGHEANEKRKRKSYNKSVGVEMRIQARRPAISSLSPCLRGLGYNSDGIIAKYVSSPTRRRRPSVFGR